MARITGTYRSEIVTGTQHADNLWGDGGDDTVYGGAGADMISDGYLHKPTPGLENDDFYFGGRGEDTIYTQSGRDHLFGNRGDDRFFAYNLGSFFVEGGRGRDVLHVSDAFEIVSTHGDRMVLRGNGEEIDVRQVERVVFHDEW